MQSELAQCTQHTVQLVCEGSQQSAKPLLTCTVLRAHSLHLHRTQLCWVAGSLYTVSAGPDLRLNFSGQLQHHSRDLPRVQSLVIHSAFRALATGDCTVICTRMFFYVKSPPWHMNIRDLSSMLEKYLLNSENIVLICLFFNLTIHCIITSIWSSTFNYIYPHLPLFSVNVPSWVLPLPFGVTFLLFEEYPL